jgi:NitT/TauT family transport system substrate-binding protein
MRSLSVAAASVALLAFAVGAVALPAPAQQAPLVHVRFAGTPNDDMTTVVYAQQTGMFRKAGLDVEIEKTTSGSAVATGVAGGAYDVGKASISSIFDAHQRGVPFTVVAPAGIYTSKEPYGGMLVAKSATLHNGKDVEGKTFSVASLSSIGRVAMAAWTDTNGGDVNAVKFVELPFTAVGAAIEQQRIAGGEIGQPMQTENLATGRYQFLPAYSAIAPEFYVSVFFTTKTFSEKHPEAVAALAKVLYEAARFANAHPDASVKMMADYTGVPLATMQKIPRVLFATDLKLAEIQPAIDAAAKYGTLKHGFPARELIDANAPAR